MIQPCPIEPIHGLKRYLFYVPGIAFQLFIGEDAQEKVPTCINWSCDGKVMYENISLTMRNTGRTELKDVERPQKLLNVIADLDKKGLGVRLGD